MWYLVGFAKFSSMLVLTSHRILFRWGGGIVWTLNVTFFSQQKLLENQQSSEWTMIITCILKTQKHKIRLTFQIWTKPTSLDGVFFFFFGKISPANSDNDNDTSQAATEAFEATAGRYRCGTKRQQGKSVPAAGWEFPQANGGGCFLGEFAPPKKPNKHHSGWENFSTLGGQLWWQKKHDRGRFFF